MTQAIVSAFAWVPPAIQGLVRDLRVRWALEEAGLGYDQHLLGLGEHKSEAYKRLQPFGQVPAYQQDGLVLFETGAIVLHIGERAPALLPAEPAARARAISWMFAALNTVEPPILFFGHLRRQAETDPAAAAQRDIAEGWAQTRLDDLAQWLGQRDYLEGSFTAGDLLMAAVLRNLSGSDLAQRMPVLAAYQARCEARPAFQRALAAQAATYAEHAPPS